ncbi:DUF2130 domain-containing protein [Candidatus Gottesmanbacteria bacterium]|nr:DUF2130 domain-containing protein [Candidatus Gottesmanbacteria bacterium]
MRPTTIKCTNCGEEIEITQALFHEVEEEATKKAREKAVAEVNLQMKDRQNQVNELRQQNKALTEQLLDLNRSIRELKDAEEKRSLEYEKRLNEAVDKEREELAKTLTEKSQMEVLELKKQLDDTKKSLDDAKNKLAQKSQQLQGEVLELDIEGKLKSAFVYDDIAAVGKGTAGADILQTVKNQAGKVAGTILWETKRAKWSPSWLPKLREDARQAGATVVVLISESVPEDIDGFGLREGVVVATYVYLLPLAELLRRAVMQVASAKSMAANKDEKLEFLYQYIASDTFRHRFEAYAESIRGMEEDLASERRSMERLWKKREMQIRRALDNMAKMYGELQGVMGSALPEIRAFSLPEPSETAEVRE